MSDEDSSPNTPSNSGSVGEPYCGACGYSLKGLENSSKCPECGRPIVSTLMRRGFPTPTGRRYRSKSIIFGLPVVDIALGPVGTERLGRARGFIAVGDVAVGVLAIGGVSRGVVAIGGVAMGVFSLGGLALGLATAAGGAGVSTGIAAGGLALGTVATGGICIGAIAQGGLAIGHLARGGMAVTNQPRLAMHAWDWLLGRFPPRGIDALVGLIWAIGPGVLLAALIGLWGYSRIQSEE